MFFNRGFPVINSVYPSFYVFNPITAKHHQSPIPRELVLFY